jgi:hypothetical protein
VEVKVEVAVVEEALAVAAEEVALVGVAAIEVIEEAALEAEDWTALITI